MTIYVFGAGASRHAGYPLASQMATELFAWMRKFPADSKYPHVAEKLLEHFGPDRDIEDVITDLQESVIKNLEDRLEYHQLQQCRTQLSFAIGEWFREIHASPAPGCAAFANGIVRRGDVVVTFNYDDSLERELRLAGKWDVRRGYGFPVGDDVQSPTLLRMYIATPKVLLATVLSYKDRREERISPTNFQSSVCLLPRQARNVGNKKRETVERKSQARIPRYSFAKYLTPFRLPRRESGGMPVAEETTQRAPKTSVQNTSRKTWLLQCCCRIYSRQASSHS